MKTVLIIVSTLFCSQFAHAGSTATDYAKTKAAFERAIPVKTAQLLGTWKWVSNSVSDNCGTTEQVCIEDLDGLKDAKGRPMNTFRFSRDVRGLSVTVLNAGGSELDQPVNQGPLTVLSTEPQIALLLFKDGRSPVPMTDAFATLNCRLSRENTDLLLCSETKFDNHTDPGHLRAWSNEIVGYKKVN